MEDKFNQDFKSQKNISKHDKVRNILVSLLILGIGILIGFFIPHEQLNKVSESPRNDVSQSN